MNTGSTITISTATMTGNDFDFMAINNEIQNADTHDRLRDIGQRIGKDETISPEVKERLRKSYAIQIQMLKLK